MIRKLVKTGSAVWYPCNAVKQWASFLVANGPRPTKALPHVVNRNILLSDRKAIYFYIPKVACSSIATIVLEALGEDEIKSEDLEAIHKFEYPSARRYRIAIHYADYFKFGFVRNPWDRVVSCYKDKIGYHKGHVYEVEENLFVDYLKRMGVSAEGLSFEEFVEVICGIDDVDAEAHFRSQHTFFEDGEGNYLPDFVGKFENLQSDFESVRVRIGVSKSIPRLRSTVRRSYKEYYDAKRRDMVETRYAKDIEMFGYSFDE